MRMSSRWIEAALIVAAVVGTGGAAQAAVRVCQPAIAVGPFEAASENEAKRRALEAWTREAAKHGRDFSGWNVAVNKELKCLPGETGTFRCAARGEPCRIQQQPNKRPRSGPNRPIDT